MGKLRIPHTIGMVLAGALLGKHGLDALDRDNSFEPFGNVELYYIMFLAALEVGVEGVRKNKYHVLTFGLFTFATPLALAHVSSVSTPCYSVIPSLPLGYITVSNTLIVYPIVNRYGP